MSEAKRISLAYLFDPFLAVQTSTIDPLPHQIDAVYSQMLPRQPLRFLLADDPGAGKTIMAGLYCKELMIRGDVERCLVIVPGSLVEQWQDELWQKWYVVLCICLGAGYFGKIPTAKALTELPQYRSGRQAALTTLTSPEPAAPTAPLQLRPAEAQPAIRSEAPSDASEESPAVAEG